MSGDLSDFAETERVAERVLAESLDPCAAFRLGRAIEPVQDADNDEDEVQFVGSSNATVLPHFSFDCAEGGCRKCFCYVCDVSARDCDAWRGDHELATKGAAWDARRVAARTARRGAAAEAAPMRAFDARVPRRAARSGDCGCGDCVRLRDWAAGDDGDLELRCDDGWRGRRHVMDEVDARYGHALAYTVRTAGGAPTLVVTRLAAAPKAPRPQAPRAKRAPRPAMPDFALSARSRAVAGLEPLRRAEAVAPSRRSPTPPPPARNSKRKPAGALDRLGDILKRAKR